MMLRSDGPAKRRGWCMLGATVLLAALTGGAAAPSGAGSYRMAAESAPDATGSGPGEDLGATERTVRPARPDTRESTAALEGRTQSAMQSLSTVGPAPGPQGQAPVAPQGSDDAAGAGVVEEVTPGDEPCPPRQWARALPGELTPAMDAHPAERYGDHLDGDGADDGRREDDVDEEDDGDRDHGDDGWDGRSEGGERH